MSAPIEMPKPVVKGRPCLGRHVANEGIREWFVRENWLLTERDVQRLLTLRRSVVARYYSEWGVADTTERVEDVRPASRSEADLIRVPPPVE
jgi:hypothetical protein